VLTTRHPPSANVGGRSVGIVRSWTEATEFGLFWFLDKEWDVETWCYDCVVTSSETSAFMRRTYSNRTLPMKCDLPGYLLVSDITKRYF
jgi:hypothetical protein